MRKDELLHLHQLLALCREDFQRRGVVASDAFAAYDGAGVGPMAIYAAKAEHQRAVQALAAALSGAVESASDERAVASP